MAATCPICQRPIDPVRAPVVRVHGARVIGYCSPACADAASGIARADAAPAARAPASAEVRSPDSAGPDVGPGVAVRADAPSATDHRRRRRNQVVALCGATIAGGMAIAIVEAVSPSAPTRVDAAIATANRPPPPPPEVTAAGLEAKATAALRARLTSPSPRIRRIAATALARTRDPAALAALADALTEESSEIARLDIAYALGRGGDPRGVAALGRAVAASSRRDVKADAARLLLQLGDRGGVELLKQIGDMAQHKLAVAEILAAAGDAEGLATLAEVRADSGSTPDERLRAAVALGRAGAGQDAPGLRDELRAALDDGRYNVGAAAALARLGDASAWPALEAQLAVPSLRVGAAIQLRRLRPDLDPVPLLPALAAALDADGDVAAVSAAEALLILLGPAELAARD